MATETTDYQDKDVALATGDSSDAWDGLLVIGGYLLVRQLPSLLDSFFNFASQFMSNGYAVHMKKGDFELRIGNGKDMWEAGGKADDGAVTLPSEGVNNRLNAASA